MKIKILSSASQDLIDGYWFYEKQAEGLGTYFLDSLFSDIDSLIINAGIHPLHFGKYHIIVCDSSIHKNVLPKNTLFAISPSSWIPNYTSFSSFIQK